MSYRNEVVEKVDDFIVRHSISANQFGAWIAHDTKFLWRLRHGHSHYFGTLERAERFMTMVDEIPGQPTHKVIRELGEALFEARYARKHAA